MTTKNSKKEIMINEQIPEFLDILPSEIRHLVTNDCESGELVEVVIDLGRELEVRFSEELIRHGDFVVSQEQIDFILERVGDFAEDNRAGIERTLHRISAIRNRHGKVIGITCRVGRAVYGTIDIIRDIVEENKSILMLGRPGVGKTTKLREISRILSDEFGKRVIVVDTSNEIAGDGDIPHAAIGHARRMQVASHLKQEQVMIEAVENHMPEVVVIDEISTEAEAMAARTIAERGVMLVATAHGQCIENLVANPSLSDLVGGIQTVTLSDDEASRRGTQKSVQERMSPPTFDIVIEIMDMNKIAVHKDVALSVDKLLRGITPRPEIRVRQHGNIKVVQRDSLTTVIEQENENLQNGCNLQKEHYLPPVVKIFPYGISRNRLEKSISDLSVPARIVKHYTDADIVITIKNYDNKSDNTLLREIKELDIPIYVIKSNTNAQITNVMRVIFGFDKAEAETEALEELFGAIAKFKTTGEAQELEPQNSFIRRIQHKVAFENGYLTESVGNEPYRRVKIFNSKS